MRCGAGVLDVDSYIVSFEPEKEADFVASDCQTAIKVNRRINSLVNSSRQTRFTVFLILDVVLILLGIWSSYFLRMDTFIITDFRLVLLGLAGIQIAAGLSSYRGTEVVGFIDDSSLLQNQSIQSKRVYPSENLSVLVVTMEVSEILLAMPSVSRGRRVEILSALESLPIPVRTLPDIASIASGKVKVQDIREISVVDLLGRESVSLDRSLMLRNIDNRVVMVTDAGGSIGAELCRQISLLNPKRIILFEQSEFHLYKIDRELRSREVEFVSVLGSVSDIDHITERCKTLKVDTIFHAAAYKHVPLVEANPAIGVKNNVFGTHATAMAAIRANVKSFVLISTDKAVRPTNVMGATKRFSELILQSINDHAIADQTRFIIVRFGNAIDSSGSVIPLFRDQINIGGPVTVTHKEVTRYFMTIPVAAQIRQTLASVVEGYSAT